MSLADRWRLGFDCAGKDNATAHTVKLAMAAPGSFVKRRGEAALIVVPAAGLAALVRDG